MGGDIAKPQPRDIMLIPATLPPNVFSAAEAQVFNQNRTWSSQWKAKLPGRARNRRDCEQSFPGCYRRCIWTGRISGARERSNPDLPGTVPTPRSAASIKRRLTWDPSRDS